MPECCSKCGNCHLEVENAYPDMEKQDGSYTEIRRCISCGAGYATYFASVDEWKIEEEASF